VPHDRLLCLYQFLDHLGEPHFPVCTRLLLLFEAQISHLLHELVVVVQILLFLGFWVSYAVVSEYSLGPNFNSEIVTVALVVSEHFIVFVCVS